MQITCYPLDITYREGKENVQVYLFARTLEGKTICLVDDFSPYFYAEAKEDIKPRLEKLEVKDGERTITVRQVEKVKKKLGGKSVALYKITCSLPRDVPKVRDAIKDAVKTYEYDILFTRRYLVDKNITPLLQLTCEVEEIQTKLKVDSYRLLSFTQEEHSLEDAHALAVDIETYAPSGASFSPEEHPVIMIALYGKGFKKVLTWKKVEHEHVEVLDGEAAMLTRFSELIQEYKPGMLVGYFSDGFDLPYLRTRAKHHKLKLHIGLDHDEIKLGKGSESTASITGIPHIDVFKFIRRTMGRDLETSKYGLDHVAEELLGERKDEVDLGNLADVWDNQPKELATFVAYNLKDADLTYRLFEKVYPSISEMVRLVGMMPFDVNRMAFSQLVEWFIIKQTKAYDEVIRNKPKGELIRERRGIKVQGAFVYEPKPGLYHDLVVFDFRSLYPTIISAHNIGLGSIGCRCCKGKDNQNPDDKGIWYCTKKKGFLPAILEQIITRRMRIKEILKETPDDMFLQARVYTLKILANAFYGYLGFYASRWYSKESAAATTAFSRFYIKKTIDQVTKEGFPLVYSDTDSIFVTLEGKDRKDAQQFVEKLNQDLPGLMELEYEGFYPSALFVGVKDSKTGAKKKYALLDEQDKLKVTGFEAIRRNVSIIAKKTQEEVLRIVLMQHDGKKAMEYVKEVVHAIRKKKTPNEDMVIQTRLSKGIQDYEAVGPHVAVAQRMQEKGISVGLGTTVSFIIGEGTGRIRDKARMVEEVKQGAYDAEYYIEHQVLPAIDSILAVFDYGKEDVLEAEKQDNLKKYFG